ncbi:MAG: hypothetical protein MHMPM18_002142 [Marteilia pararefringens]
MIEIELNINSSSDKNSAKNLKKEIIERLSGVATSAGKKLEVDLSSKGKLGAFEVTIDGSAQPIFSRLASNSYPDPQKVVEDIAAKIGLEVPK